MKTCLKILIFMLPLLILLSCSNKDRKKLITERIQYDVNIKSPDPEYDWWIQNLEGSNRETFVKMIINAAFKGDLKAWDIFHNPMSVDDIKALCNRSDTITTTSPNPPYNDTIMVVKQELDLQRITRVRFLEEWRMDEKTLEFDKKIMGIAPVMEVFNDDGSLRGYMPLFWIYIDKEYPGKYTLKP